MKRIITSLCIITMLLNVTACGTILYPERKGQVSGRIDPGVAVLNGVGLLFFLIPGVVAFAVDFGNGTIYLPEDSLADSEDEILTIKVSTKDLTQEKIAKIIHEQTGQDVSFENAEIFKWDKNGQKVRVN